MEYVEVDISGCESLEDIEELMDDELDRDEYTTFEFEGEQYEAACQGCAYVEYGIEEYEIVIEKVNK